MTSSVAFVVIFVLTCVSIIVDSIALRSHRTSQRNDNAKKLDPIVAPLYIAQYDRFDGTVSSVPDFYYQLPLGVGTPARDFNLTLDLYGGENLLFAQNFTGTTDCARYQPARNLYSIGSTAYEINTGVDFNYFGQPYVNAKCSLPAGEDLEIDGDGLHDDLKISNTTVGKLAFNLVEAINTLNPGWNSDGIFSYYADTDEDDQSFLTNFHKWSTVLHLLSEAQPAAGSPKLGGHLIFGAVSENSMCFDDWTAVDTILPGFAGDTFGVNLAAVKLGNETVRNTARLIAGLFQLNSAYIKLNKASLNYFAKALGAEYDFRRDSFTVDCGAVTSLPDIVFRIKNLRATPPVPANGSMEYRVPANAYAKKLDPVSSLCTLMIRECDAGDDDCTYGRIWRLGSAFIRPYCQRIHYGYNNALGPILSFAMARF